MRDREREKRENHTEVQRKKERKGGDERETWIERRERPTEK